MSELEAHTSMDDDFLSVDGFRDGQERRASPRIALTKPVRVGPPGGVPHSAISAADLSVGGLFIDADRPVRVGARFSVQVPLNDGTSVYVEEAEVVYNRESSSAPGFGVRFVRIDPGTEVAIREEIERLSPKNVASRPWTFIEESPTVVPAAFGGDVAAIPSVYDEPSTPKEASSEARAFPAVSVAGQAWKRGKSMAGWFKRHGRQFGLFLGAAAAVTVLTATVVFLASNAKWVGPGERPESSGGVPSADTHKALMANEPPAAKVMPPPPSPAPAQGDKRRPLPDLVIIEEPEEVPPSEDRAPTEADPSVDEFVFKVSSRARVRRQMIYRKPERVVVDLFDQEPGFQRTATPAGGIRRFRVGRHPGFVRLVLDASRPIKAARASIAGRRLRVTVTYR